MDDNEQKQVEVTIGDYAGRRLTMPAADADAAVAEGWAIDPHGPPLDPNAEPKPAPTEEERDDMLKKADRAIRKLRGEEVEEGEASEETRDMSADEGGEYQTRRAGPGRPKRK